MHPVAPARPDRRRLLTAAGMMLAAGFVTAAVPGRAQAAGPGPRLAAIDWAMLETAVALGRMPAAACELVRYREAAVAPAIPAEVTDLGLRGAPNFELLQLIRPDLILSSPYYTSSLPRFEAIAPVLSLPFFTPGEAPLPKAMAALDLMGAALDDTEAATAARGRAEARLDALALRLRRFGDRPVAVIDLGDARHMRVFGADSLFGSTLERLGLANAWTEGTKFGFLAPVPVERLAAMPEARVVVVGEIEPQTRRDLDRSVLWRALPPVAEGRLHQLPEVNAFGAVPSALRFADLLADALEGRA